MTMPPIPVAALLVPDHPRAAPDGFTRVDAAITRGLPHAIALADDLRLTVILPTGLARTWRETDPATLVTASDGERTPSGTHTAAPVGDTARAPLRLVVEVAGEVVAVVPVVAGRRQTIPDIGDPAHGARVELEIIAWSLAAGTVRGAGDYGSRISLAWRRADRAELQFEPPAINPTLQRRLDETEALAAATGRV